MVKNIRFDIIVPEKTVYCKLNKSKIMSAMDNLILNAIKFSFNDSVITIRLTNDDRYAVLSVIDTGIGIPESIQKVIFEPYTIAGRSGTCNEKSTGLGLSIVKKIVDMHNGEIRVESVEGKGSRFILQFPLS
jgi:two-component system sensor histidine kinase VicK